MRITRRWLEYAAAPAGALLFLGVGAVARIATPTTSTSTIIWTLGLVLTGMAPVFRTLRGVLVGRFASDLVATLAIVGALLLSEPVAGLVIVLMQTGGEALERYAEGRASDAVRALEEAAPRTAHRLNGTRVDDVSAVDVATGDLLLVRPGELVPCDAVVIDGRSHVDVSRLTGEPMPITALSGTRLMSGSVNGEGSLTVRATATAGESQYAHIVALVRSAQASKAHLQRLADRYAVWFTPLTLATCAVVYAFTHDAVRVLAVLVVATPCPLILATPIAFIGGINLAARRHIIVRTGDALERLARITTIIFDKTGTLTIGRPAVNRVVPAPGLTETDVLRAAGAVEQGSSHLLARTLVEAAEVGGIALPTGREVIESAGRGVSGLVDGRSVTVGSRSFVLERHPRIAADLDALDHSGGLEAYVAIDGRAAGVVEYADRLRPELHDAIAHLARIGLTDTILLSGDRSENARAVAAAAGIDEVAGDLMPEDKVDAVRRLVTAGRAVLMVGDGTNDAPALSAATVGVALAGHGGGITAEAADVVVLADDLRRVPEVISIGRRTLRIARESIRAGLALSAIAMVLAAFGFIVPAVGAVLQEVIDVAVIVNALRASRPA
ncbi:MAG TPA: heavy metal translocating P-type ATPase [Gemmatimonadaceae bacterium]|nr:heavy metal translocating P-type ATPase [Gemmatimonadaceae bacterium]